MLDLELFEKVNVFFLKCLFVVMAFLIRNVVVHIFNLRMAVGKCPVAFLPPELSFYPGMVIDEIGGVIFHVPNQIRERHGWFKPDENMHMIGDTVDDDGLLSLIFDDPRHILENLIPPFFLEQILTSLHSKDNLNINLGICTCHVSPPKSCNRENASASPIPRRMKQL